jgi:hypothetical protein
MKLTKKISLFPGEASLDAKSVKAMLRLYEGKKRRQRAADGASERAKKLRYIQSRNAITKEAWVWNRPLLYPSIWYHTYVWRCDEVMNNSQARKPTDILDVCRQIRTCPDNSKGCLNLLETINNNQRKRVAVAYSWIPFRLVEVEANGPIQPGQNTSQK